MSAAYHPDFERALEHLLLAANDSAEFADNCPHGRSRSASLRRLRTALSDLHQVSQRIVIERRAEQLRQQFANAGRSQAHAPMQPSTSRS